MKKRICLILAIFLVWGTMLALFACVAIPEESALDTEIKTAYLKRFPDKTQSKKELTLEYIVKFDDIYIVTISGPGIDATVGGGINSLWFKNKETPILLCGFYFDPYMDYIAYRDGEIYSIREAVIGKLLSSENLLTLQEARKRTHASFYTDHDKVTREIKTAYLGMEGDIYVGYYGEFYNEPDVFVVLISGSLADTAMTALTVDGVDYHFSDTTVFTVYRDGKFCTLQEAFDSGYLTHDDLLTVQANHKTTKPDFYD